MGKHRRDRRIEGWPRARKTVKAVAVFAGGLAIKTVILHLADQVLS